MGIHRLCGPWADHHEHYRGGGGRESFKRRDNSGLDERADHRVGGRGCLKSRARLLSRGGLGHGGRWKIVYRVLFPAAKNGLLAAVLLGLGRAIGETMAVLMATGNAVQIPHSLLDPIATLTATIASELGEAVEGGTHYRVLFLIGVVLFVVTFIVNLTADLVIKGFRTEKEN